MNLWTAKQCRDYDNWRTTDPRDVEVPLCSCKPCPVCGLKPKEPVECEDDRGKTWVCQHIDDDKCECEDSE